ncbi:MAG: putative toxin-antitoxin system toxin component, PIN family [Nitriliruptor sp.]|nr:MAG: putative toxin-antitoxin system toxin component, PIN family [Nitriliruptor sp.]
MKVVLGTNVLVPALVFPGVVPEQVYRLAIEGGITLVTSPPLLAELGRVLTEKLGWRDDYLWAALAQIVRIGEIAEPVEHVSVIADDPDDDRVLEAAQTAGAAVIVGGDRHLLGLGHWGEVAILGPAEFLADLGSE